MIIKSNGFVLPLRFKREPQFPGKAPEPGWDSAIRRARMEPPSECIVGVPLFPPRNAHNDMPASESAALW